MCIRDREMGQPMHAFDLNKVAGRTIDVRRAHEGEKIVTLDEKEFTLNPNNLVICDCLLYTSRCV